MIDPAHTHPCAAKNCKRDIASKFLMCFPHWRMVSQGTQADVYRTYRAGLRNNCHPTTEYLRAVNAAIREVEAKRA